MGVHTSSSAFGYALVSSVIAAVLVSFVVLWLSGPWLWVLSSSLASMGLGAALHWAWNRWHQRQGPDGYAGAGHGQRMPVAVAAEEIRAVVPYLSVMRGQLEGALHQAEEGVVALISLLDQMHAASQEQVERIASSQQQGAEITQVFHDKVLIDRQLGAILKMFVEKQEQDETSNVERIQRLQEVKQLSGLVDVITNVAQQTNFLAINATIEAARAGPSGKGFAVVAAEIRLLSTRTASAAKEIAQRIAAVTDGIDSELAQAVDVNQRHASTSNMRHVLTDIEQMQERFAEASQHMEQIIAGVDRGHSSISLCLTEAMGHMQFHDVLRQRVEHVQAAMIELDQHLQSMTDQLIDHPWDPATMTTLKERLEAHIKSYVMQSQIDAHQAAMGTTPTAGAATNDRPKIELF
ncbi:MAG: methyl-accepting chemotaxis protein [Giesbergeria sp.]|uniref:methyl-accepting chemotaxis protein n=1 Tax=Giesbergeria sp. TaxID=2818473 RepID=UPI0026270735|nr:methyl-accepting chemotaxis protein [Giesbergeria sp.]MDD2608384.1 methyl-accepting chemotaxis protein [Giesbergeria sp.]